jgi:transaldolase
MPTDSYLDWVLRNTKTVWWHDSAELGELQVGLERGAVGVTTNPFLTNLAVSKHRKEWAKEIEEAAAKAPSPESKAEALMRLTVTRVAEKLLPEFERSGRRMGYVCAQVNPSRAGDRDAMLAMAQRFHGWAPNIAVKLPATAAGLDVLEECTSQGITATATVSFTVPQVVAVAEAHRRGIRRAQANGTEPGRCFAVIMIGRLDDYLREVAQDTQAGLEEAEIRQAGLAVSKRAYQIYRQCRYEAVLLIAALRGAHHFTELAGGELIMSIAPKYQELFVGDSLAREVRIDQPAPEEAVGRLRRVPEFVRAYEPDGMAVKEFIGYGVTQRTLSQFAELGWNLLENFQ